MCSQSDDMSRDKGYDDAIEALRAALQADPDAARAVVALLGPQDDREAEPDLPNRVVVGRNGAYWRDYGSHYSMCPVSEDNDPVEPVAIYVRDYLDPILDAAPQDDREAEIARIAGERDAAVSARQEAERVLARLIESADAYETEARSRRLWDEGGPTETVIRGIQQYRATLARTREPAGEVPNG